VWSRGGRRTPISSDVTVSDPSAIPNPDRPVRIGLLGCGTVGQAFARMISEQGDTIARASGRRLELGPILVRDTARPRAGIDPSLFTSDPRDVLAGPGVDLIVEVMGGIAPTADYLRAALEAGIPVVTANKQLLSRHGAELLALAATSGTELRFEASACAAIPVIKVLRESMLAAEISAVTGIVNGTTNYILTEMARSGLGYAEALAQAQDLGYAEADPTEDVGGADAAAKMAILSSIAFHTNVRFDDVPYEGIDGVHAEDIELARDLGFVVKLLGVARLVDDGISVRVHPALVPERHRLAAVMGPDNAVLLESGSVREIMLVGPGAGGTETASAVLADVLSILGTARGSFLHNALADAGRPLLGPEQTASAFYVRLNVLDRPGVLARVATVFADAGLSIRSVIQRGEGDGAQLVLVTHVGSEARMTRALDAMRGMDEVRDEPVLLRLLTEDAA
jgi:homoserine dehydrogenase